jgi:hypothetical protein
LRNLSKVLTLMSGDYSQTRVEVVFDAGIEGRDDAQLPEIESLCRAEVANHLFLKNVELGKNLVFGLDTRRHEGLSRLQRQSDGGG